VGKEWSVVRHALTQTSACMALKVWDITVDNVELNMREPVSAYTLLLAAIISKIIPVHHVAPYPWHGFFPPPVGCHS